MTYLRLKCEKERTLEIYVEILAIGNELCYGRVYDTNSFWIADQATQLGAKVRRITCVPDSVEDICASLKEALARHPHFVVITGGLGPTSDDLTIEALSKFLRVKITTSDEILQIMAKKRGVPLEQLPPNLIKMARSVEGAECLPNRVGWAPVSLIETGGTMVAALPGPPTEMKACFTEYLAKKIRDKTEYESASRRVYVTMYESQISPVIDAIMKEMHGTYLKPLVSEYQRDKALLPVELIAFADNSEACQKKMAVMIERLKEYITGKGGKLDTAEG